MNKQNTIDEIYDMAFALITDANTGFSQTDTLNFTKKISGRSYKLTIYAPKDGLSHVIKRAVPYTAPEYEGIMKKGPRGEIMLTCDGQPVKTFTTSGAVAPGEKRADNFVKRYFRRNRENLFFMLLFFAEKRQKGSVVLHNNDNLIQECLEQLLGRSK